ncbi:unnamed protein product [Spirodela intermedia]|uniref:F-box domain-containing protein n=2 Tax=Spirodela intermedia TaxID=51605 RepID=A0A7I8IHU8_SPIIN|nr:unnamed protein product [Spirodela intermedia]CAA6657296.1 unnamed protein product [Spirodela intermedia]CAA7393340.1 unnamed protein product [Spirodela intermedia]
MGSGGGAAAGAVEPEKRRRTLPRGYCINDNEDLLAEILCRLDGRSLGVAACVCRLWRALSRGDALWERLCVRHAGRGVGAEAKAVVLALGGYQRLYRACVGPVLARKMARRGRASAAPTRPPAAWSRDEAQLSLSLFSIDCYERLGGKRSSLMFLCPAR